jgi:putative transposase
MERKRNRLEGYNYSYEGYYFITICIDKRKCVLGSVKEGKLMLNANGEKVKSLFLESPAHYNNLIIDEVTIMPNHIHAIYIIKNQEISRNGDAQCTSPTNDKYGLISKVVQAFKSISGKRTGISWQRSFWDHVIRTEESYLKIKEYIINNPVKWELDVENPSSDHKDIKKYYEDITGYVPPERKGL